MRPRLSNARIIVTAPFLLLAAFIWTPASIASEVKLSTLNWAPYTGEKLPKHGATSVVIAAAFKAVGQSAHFTFSPWKRAILAAWKGQKGSAAYFPGYHCKHRPGAKFIQSKSVGTAPLGFAFLKSRGFPNWSSLKQLKGLRIGYVVGYGSTAEFEMLEKKKILTVLRNSTDAINLKNLATGNLDAVLIDRMVFRYLMQTTPNLKAHVGKLSFAKKPLEQKQFYVCFRDDPKGRKIAKSFNKGLSGLSVPKIVDRYFATAFK